MLFINILILNGPNLNLLGIREPQVYGSKTYQDLTNFCLELGKRYGCSVKVEQTNYEGQLLDWLHQARGTYEGIILNAGALTHYSYALYDAIKAIAIPVVEVHLSDITKREPFRKVSVIHEACVATFMGEHFQSYEKALLYLIKKEKHV